MFVPDSEVVICNVYCFSFRPKFGGVVPLSSNDFVDQIDKENPQVYIIVHVYEDVSTDVIVNLSCYN